MHRRSHRETFLTARLLVGLALGTKLCMLLMPFLSYYPQSVQVFLFFATFLVVLTLILNL